MCDGGRLVVVLSYTAQGGDETGSWNAEDSNKCVDRKQKEKEMAAVTDKRKKTLKKRR
jgi:hypothetical protein